jgi:peptide/nickel transport system substrate-binding protein
LSSPPVLTRRDHVVVGSLVLVLALIAGAIAVPAFAPSTAVGPTLEPVASGVTAEPSAVPVDRPVRIGLLGAPRAVNPLVSTTRSEQALVSLVFSGLVALGDGQTIVPDLAARWTTTEDGRQWTFTLRDDASWHDGEPVTAEDVAFTVGLLRDPAYTGPGAASWRDVTATAVDERTVRFELTAPIGGFLQAATQPILPRHLLADVPLDRLAAAEFNRRPVGSGRYRLDTLTADMAALTPAHRDRPASSESSPSPRPDDPDATVPPAGLPLLSADAEDLELHFYPDATSLSQAFEGADLDLAGDLAPEEARRLAGTPSTRLVRYPTATLTTVLINLRPARPELRDPKTRVALLRAIDRPGIVAEAWQGQAVVADSLIPTVSWAFDPAASPNVPYDRSGAADALAAAGWIPNDGKWTAPGGDKPFTLELLSPDLATNPAAYVAAASVAADWRRIGLTVTHMPLPAQELVAERLRTGNFAAAVVDVNVGLDPDLYPLLASTQTLSSGLNLAGLVDRQLDALLVAARAPGSGPDRRAAYKALQARLAAQQYQLPIAFRDELWVARDTLDGLDSRQVGGPGDRFWDVLTWRLADDR